MILEYLIHSSQDSNHNHNSNPIINPNSKTSLAAASKQGEEGNYADKVIS